MKSRPNNEIMPAIFNRCRADSAAGGGSLRPDSDQGYQGDGGVPGVGAGDHQVSDEGVPD